MKKGRRGRDVVCVGGMRAHYRLPFSLSQVKASPSILRDLRKIFFGDSHQENSEVFFKLIERPDKVWTHNRFILPPEVSFSLQLKVHSPLPLFPPQMVFVTGDPNQVQQNVLDTFEKQGVLRDESNFE